MRLLAFFSVCLAALSGFVFIFCCAFIFGGARIENLTTLQDLELILRRSSEFWYVPYLLTVSGLVTIWFTVLAFGAALAVGAQARHDALMQRIFKAQQQRAQQAQMRSIYDS